MFCVHALNHGLPPWIQDATEPTVVGACGKLKHGDPSLCRCSAVHSHLQDATEPTVVGACGKLKHGGPLILSLFWMGAVLFCVHALNHGLRQDLSKNVGL